MGSDIALASLLFQQVHMNHWNMLERTSEGANAHA